MSSMDLYVKCHGLNMKKIYIERNTIIMCYCLDLPKEIERDKEMNTHIQISTH